MEKERRENPFCIHHNKLTDKVDLIYERQIGVIATIKDIKERMIGWKPFAIGLVTLCLTSIFGAGILWSTVRENGKDIKELSTEVKLWKEQSMIYTGSVHPTSNDSISYLTDIKKQLKLWKTSKL